MLTVLAPSEYTIPSSMLPSVANPAQATTAQTGLVQVLAESTWFKPLLASCFGEKDMSAGKSCKLITMQFALDAIATALFTSGWGRSAKVQNIKAQISEFSTQRQWRNALTLVEAMTHERFKPDIITYTTMFSFPSRQKIKRSVSRHVLLVRHALAATKRHPILPRPTTDLPGPSPKPVT